MARTSFESVTQTRVVQFVLRDNPRAVQDLQRNSPPEDVLQTFADQWEFYVVGRGEQYEMPNGEEGSLRRSFQQVLQAADPRVVPFSVELRNMWDRYLLLIRSATLGVMPSLPFPSLCIPQDDNAGQQTPTMIHSDVLFQMALCRSFVPFTAWQLAIKLLPLDSHQGRQINPHFVHALLSTLGESASHWATTPYHTFQLVSIVHFLSSTFAVASHATNEASPQD